MSMQQPFKFRHLDSIVGAFVLTAVAIVIAALALIGSAKQLFVSKTSIRASSPPVANKEEAVFYEDLTENLKPGTPVELAGQVVGTVTAATVDGGRLIMTLHVTDKALAELNRNEARALIKAPMAAFMGQPIVVLKAGSTKDPVAQGWTTDKWHELHDLPINKPSDTTAMAQRVLSALEANLGPMLSAITSLVTESRDLVKEIREQRLPQQAGELIAGVRERQVPQRLDALLARIEVIATTAEAISADAKRLSAGVAAGQGIAGKALTDAKFAEDIAGLVADLRAISGELRKAAPTAPGLAEGAGNLLDEVQRLIDGLNRHWLLKSYVEPGSSERIVPPGIIDAPEPKP